MKPKVKIKTLVWRDDNDQLETQLIVDGKIIDDYCGDDCYIVAKVLKSLGYEVEIKHYTTIE